MLRKESSKDCQKMTTNQGEPIYNDTDSLTIGEDGPILLTDRHLLDKIGSVNRERMPPRIVHAQGSGAHGYFVCYQSMEKYTKAKVFTETRCKVPTFARFSTVAGDIGSADTARDPRGFAVKFYTSEGNYDIIGLNIPVFFMRDAMRFPDLLHAFKNSPITNLPDPNTFWDYVVSAPESTQAILMVFSDLGTRKSFIKLPGHGIHTYVWVNKDGKRYYVKYHWKPLDGDEWITAEEATKLAGEDPNVARRELYDTLNKGEKAEWDLLIQIMEPSMADSLPFNVLDPTKQWPENEFPLTMVGRLTLTDAPGNFYEEVEQVAFSPSNLVPGIDVSRDKLLQGRTIAYHDAQRYRIGVNFEKLPINKPLVPIFNNERDGKMQFYIHSGFDYSPNTLSDNQPEPAIDKSPAKAEYVQGYEIRKLMSSKEYDNFTQAGEFYRDLPKVEQDHLVKNLIGGLTGVNNEIVCIILSYLMKSDMDLYKRVTCGLKKEEDMKKFIHKK